MKVVTLYTKASNASSRKAINFLREHNIPYREVRIRSGVTISREHLDLLIRTSENGFEDIVSRNALKDILNLHTEECKTYIMNNPKILRAPAAVQGCKAMCGYNEDEYGVFLTREMKNKSFQLALEAI